MTTELLARVVQELERRQQQGGVYNRFFNTHATRTEYPKHWQFFDAGATHRQRLFRAANRVGKTTAMGAEVVYHLTGRYPDDWRGKRFDGATTWWVCGKSSETVRQILQPLLLGDVGNFGTGLVPRDLLDVASLTDAKKASTGISSFRVKHVSGGFSKVEFKSYDQGRQAFEGTERSVWCDEEPPADVYGECLLRTMTGDNLFAMTFTPLKGASEVVLNFSKDGSFEDGDLGNGKYVVTATWDDVPHLNEQAKQELLASIPPYQRDARSKGVPALGAGAIYPVPESELLVDPFEIPKHWARAYGLDVGWNRTAAVWGAIDPDSNTLYLYSEHYLGEAVPSTHAAAIRARGDWVPGVIDPAARGRTQDDGNQLLQNYKDLGLDLEPANNVVESALWEILEAMQQGRFKVFRTLTNWVREYRAYSRDEKGKVVKVNDHCFVGETEVWTTNGKVPIRHLVGTSGTLLNHLGAEPYTNCRLIAKDQPLVDVVFETGTVRCTPDHLFLTKEQGWVQAQDLVGYNVLRIKEHLWTQPSSHQLARTSTVSPSMADPTCTSSTTSRGTTDAYTGSSGRTLTDLFRRVTTFTTRTATEATTALRTWSASALWSTLARSISTTAHGLRRRLTPQHLGTEAKRDVPGTENTPRDPRSSENFSAFSAASSSSVSSLSAVCVDRPAASDTTSTTCLAVRAVELTGDVYCLDVPGSHALAVGPGVIAHNCMDATRYYWNSARARAKNEVQAKGVNRQALSGLPTVGPRF